VTRAPGPDTGGPLMFVRYAYPPNALGYCGPADFAAFREYAVAGVVDRGLVQLAQAFAGAWPYLELIDRRGVAARLRAGRHWMLRRARPPRRWSTLRGPPRSR
jgi:hypothetical protein